MLFAGEESAAWLSLVRPRTLDIDEVRERLFASFEGFRVYHAARPRDVDSYYKEGLKLGSQAAQLEWAAEVFLSGEFPEITREDLKAAGGGLGLNEDGQAFVSLDARGYLSGAGHYLIYGSEHVCGIAASLTRRFGRDYRQVLKRFGTPTIFECRLPFELVSSGDLDQFLEVAVAQEPTSRRKRHLPEVDFTFRLRFPLPPECVLAHKHPSTILDPLLRMTPYTWEAP
jgi:hypothetical protein